MDDLRDRLAADLREAMRARDRATVSVLRSAMAALANAEAVPAGPARPISEAPLGAAGAGAAEADRLVLSGDDAAAVLRREVAEAEDAAAALAAAGRAGEAEALLAGAAVLRRYLP